MPKQKSQWTTRGVPTMGVDEAKYITFKRADFYDMMGRLALPPYTGHTPTGKVERAGGNWDCAPIAEEIQRCAEAMELHDAVVIRRQDVFAPPALDAYASAIQVVIEMLGQCIPIEENLALSGLQDIADYFHEQAAKAWNEQRKVPD